MFMLYRGLFVTTGSMCMRYGCHRLTLLP